MIWPVVTDALGMKMTGHRAAHTVAKVNAPDLAVAEHRVKSRESRPCR
jgi:hypothetical protein